MSMDEAATKAGISSEALRNAERGLLTPDAVGPVARLYGLEPEALSTGRVEAIANEDAATVFLLHGAYQDFDSADWAKLDRALQFGRLFISRANRAGLVERQSFVPVPVAGPLPRDAAKQGYVLAQRVRSRLGLGSAPIDNVRELVEKRLGVVVLVEQFETDDLRAASVLDAVRAGAAIVLSALDNARRRTPALNRVYIVHELAHVLFDPTAPGRVQIVLDEKPQTPLGERAQGFSRETLFESRAKAFAAEFLVPRQGVEVLLGKPAGDTTPMIAARELVEKAAEHFQTPWQLTTWHLKNLGYMAEATANELVNAGGRIVSTDTTTLPAVGAGPLALPSSDFAAMSDVPPETPPAFALEAHRIGKELAEKWALEVLERAYDEVSRGRPMAATDLLFDHLDAMLAGNLSRAIVLLD